LAAALVLSACSSEPTPREPDPSKATTATTAPAVAVPTMPPQASEDSPEGAAAFVKHYVDVFNYAAATGDVKELSRLSAPGCKGCQKYIDLYRETYEGGGYYRNGGWKIGDLNLRSSESETFATTQVKSGGGTYKTSKDAPERPSATDQIELTFGVTGPGSSRRISQLAIGGAP
jgi:hypothetical protein